MAKSQIIAALDLGSSKITTLIAQVLVDEVSYETTINIVGTSSVESRGIRKAQIVDIDEAVEATIESIEAAERMAGYNLDAAFVAVNGASVSSLNSHGVVAVSDPDGEINSDDVARVIEAASAVSIPTSREIVHVLTREFVVDGESGVRDPVRMSGVRLEADTHIISASSSTVKNLRKAIHEVGIDVESLVYSGLAAGEAVLTKTERELGCMLIDIGGGTTSVAVYVDGSIAHSFVLPIGAKNVTNDLAVGLRISLDAAEKIKRELSKSKPLGSHEEDKDDSLDFGKLGIEENSKVSKKTLIRGIVTPRLNEIFTMVKLQLDKMKLGNRIPSGAIITGGGAMTIGIVDAAKKTLHMPVRIGKPKGVSGLVDDIMEPSYSVPIGLIIYGTKTDIRSSTNSSITKKFKMSSKGVVGKVFETIKDLLP